MVLDLRYIISFVFVAAAFSVAGCGSGESGPRRSMSDVGAQLDAQSAAKAQDDQAKAEAERKAQEAQAAAVASQPPAEKLRTEAGRGQLGEGGYLVAIAGARRHVLNQIDDYAWKQAVQHFQATEGRLPKDHDEFMKRVIEPLGIDLGFKEEGQEFLYDPTPTEDSAIGTLYVVEAAAQPAPAQ
jgi:hypothetical protein